MSEEPYIKAEIVIVEHRYNPNYGDDRMCGCGHPYYRHFDTYEEMRACGCKYCECFIFEEGGPFSKIPFGYFDGSKKL
jgi:hypothetical protein